MAQNISVYNSLFKFLTLKIVDDCILNCFMFMLSFLPCFPAFGHSAIPIISLLFNGYYCSAIPISRYSFDVFITIISVIFVLLLNG